MTEKVPCVMIFRILNCIFERHPEFISGSRLFELTSFQMLKQVQHDGKDVQQVSMTVRKVRHDGNGGFLESWIVFSSVTLTFISGSRLFELTSF